MNWNLNCIFLFQIVNNPAYVSPAFGLLCLTSSRKVSIILVSNYKDTCPEQT